MRATRTKTIFALFLSVLIAAVSARPAVAQTAQQPAGKSSASAGKELPAEVAVEYTYVHSNAPPSACECFNLNGGTASFAWTFKPGYVALVGEITSAHAAGIAAAGLDLTLSSYTGGVRVLPSTGHSRLHPFGQLLLGAAHASGTLVQAPNPAATNAGAAFAFKVGGGLDIDAGNRFSFRLFDTDYLMTTFNNAVNNRQNNLRISTGLVLHF